MQEFPNPESRNRGMPPSLRERKSESRSLSTPSLLFRHNTLEAVGFQGVAHPSRCWKGGEFSPILVQAHKKFFKDSTYFLTPPSGNLGMEPARLAAQNNQDSHSLFLEAPMKNSTKDQAEGTLHEVKGKVKEQIGKTTNNPRLQDEGTDEKVAGKVQKKAGQIEKVFDN
jgi:uncharacterized protein YjbJ (UPF0337 family)